MPEIINKYLSDIPVTEFPDEIQNSVTDSHKVDTDQFLDKGGDNEVSAAHIREVVDAYQVKTSPPDPFGVVDDTVTDPKLRAWQQALAKAGEVMQNNILCSANPTLHNSSSDYTRRTSATGGSNAFWGSTIRPDKSIVFAPYSSTAVGILSAEGFFNRTITHNQGGTAFNDCTYWLENDVTVFCPSSTANICRLNSDNTFEVIVNHGQGANVFRGCSQRYDGKIIFTPYTSQAVGILNQDYSFSITAPHGKAVGSGAFSGRAAQRADGSMVFPPHYTDSIMILQPDNSLEFIQHTLKTGYQCQAAILRPDNVVVFVPTYNNDDILLLYPDNHVEVIESQCWANGSYMGFSGGLLLPNGDIIFTPYYQNIYGVLHPDNTYSQFTDSTISTYYFYGGLCNGYGKAVLTPYNSSYGNILDIKFRYKFDIDFLTRR